jgi:short-subunit dehydrogenase
MNAKYSMTPETIASAAINGLFKREPEIVPGSANTFNTFLQSFFLKDQQEK